MQAKVSRVCHLWAPTLCMPAVNPSSDGRVAMTFYTIPGMKRQRPAATCRSQRNPKAARITASSPRALHTHKNVSIAA